MKTGIWTAWGLAFLWAGLAPVMAQSGPADEVAVLKKQKDDLKKQVADLQQQLGDIKSEISNGPAVADLKKALADARKAAEAKVAAAPQTE